jgi:hypothetical protein
MPRSFRALLPVEIRTGQGPKATDQPLLSWAFAPLQSIPRSPWSRLPDSFLPALSTTILVEDDGAALQGLPELTGRVPPHGDARLS